jgi:hypothetical protein
LRRRLQPGKPPWIFTVAVRVYEGLVTAVRRSVERRKQSAGWGYLWSAEEASERFWRRGLERAIDRNPLLYRNRVANAFDPERFVASIQLLVGVGALFAFLFLAWRERGGMTLNTQFEQVGLWALVGTEILFLVCSAILAASAFARERQYGSWEVLTLTGLPARMHLTAALVGVAGTLRLLLIVIGFLSIIVGYVFSGFLPMLVWLVSMAALWLFLIVYSLWTSLFLRRIATALASVVIGLALLLIGSAVAANRDSDVFRYNVAWSAAACVFAGAAWWLAKHRVVPWSLVHISGTMALTLAVAAMSGDADPQGRTPPIRLGEYYLSRSASNAISLIAYPLSWGRRFAYGLTETIPNPMAAVAFLVGALVTSAAFLGMFRTLSAAEPGDRRRWRRPGLSPQAPRHGVG